MLKQFPMIAILICISTPAVPDEQTTWKDARISMTRLLDDGWTIQSMSSIQTNWQVEAGLHGVINVPRENPVVLPKSVELNFILAKHGKWIWCAVTDPAPVNVSWSRCRNLN
jgi:hypothetical protein